jgi:hypothetical protein
MRVVRILSHCLKPAQTALTDWEYEVDFKVNDRVVSCASLNTGLLPILYVKKLHLQAVHNIDLTCVYANH